MGGPLLLVAAGSGIVPLMAMIRHRVATGSDAPVRLLYSAARSLDDVIYRRELDRLMGDHRGLKFSYTLTRSFPSGWRGFRRRIDGDMLREVTEPLRGSRNPIQAFVCGPTGFVESAARLLVELGHDPARIKTERFGPTGG
jgi:ferredoxin-NADP reductase